MVINWTQLITASLVVFGCLAGGLAILCLRLRSVNRRLSQQLGLAMESEFLANHDFLTGLLNRRGWNSGLLESLAKYKHGSSDQLATSSQLNLVLIDLDQYKQVNDHHGHLVGDEVLKIFAKRLTEITSEQRGDLVARIGGEEFAILSSQTAVDLADRLQRLIDSLKSEPIAVSGLSIDVSCSVGIAEFLEEEAYDQWFQRADQAMFSAKQQGGGRILRSPRNDK